MAARIVIGIVFLVAVVAAIVYVGRKAPPAPSADPSMAPVAPAPAPVAREADSNVNAEAPPAEPAPEPVAPASPAPAPDAIVVPSGQSARTYDLEPGLHALVFAPPTAEQPVNYLLFLPKDYRAVDRWPLIFYLHGKSLCGDDPQLLTKYGPPRIVTRDPSFPFILVAPQCRTGKRWTDIATLDALLADVIARYPIDTERVYLTGFSMGAGGAWRFGGAKPERFAAVAALAGVEEKGSVKGLARVPVWAFHGTDDEATPASASQAMVAALRAAGGDARLELLPGRGHDILDVYDRKDLYDWFLAHRRR